MTEPCQERECNPPRKLTLSAEYFEHIEQNLRKIVYTKPSNLLAYPRSFGRGS